MRKPLNLQSGTHGIFSRISRDRDELRPFCCGQLSLHSHSLVHSTNIRACPRCVTQCSQRLGQKHAASAPVDLVEETGVSLSLFRWQKIKVPRPPVRPPGESSLWDASCFRAEGRPGCGRPANFRRGGAGRGGVRCGPGAHRAMAGGEAALGREGPCAPCWGGCRRVFTWADRKPEVFNLGGAGPDRTSLAEAQGVEPRVPGCGRAWSCTLESPRWWDSASHVGGRTTRTRRSTKEGNQDPGLGGGQRRKRWGRRPKALTGNLEEKQREWNHRAWRKRVSRRTRFERVKINTEVKSEC